MTASQPEFEHEHTTIGQLAADSPAAIPVFERYGVDYCCGGTRTLEAACRDRGLPLALVRQEIAEAVALSPVQSKDWTVAPLDDLTRHIIRYYHNRARADLPLLLALATKVVLANPAHGPMLKTLSRDLNHFRIEFESHMRKEELILFPAIDQLQRAVAAGLRPPRSSFGSLANPVRLLEGEHESVGNGLNQMRELTLGYAVPGGSDENCLALFRRLPALEQEVHQHVHLENNVLFPRALRMEEAAK